MPAWRLAPPSGLDFGPEGRPCRLGLCPASTSAAPAAEFLQLVLAPALLAQPLGGNLRDLTNALPTSTFLAQRSVPQSELGQAETTGFQSGSL